MKKPDEKPDTSSGSTAMPCYVKFGGRDYDIDCLNDEFNQAAKIAKELQTFYLKNNIPKDAIINGVVVDGFHIEETAYIRGKQFEKVLLGLRA